MENKKIPVAKDNTEMSDMVRNYWLKAGHFADHAFDGLQAIDPVKTVKPDLILLDKSLDLNLQELSETKKFFRMIFVSDKSMLTSNAWKFYNFVLLSALA